MLGVLLCLETHSRAFLMKMEWRNDPSYVQNRVKSAKFQKISGNFQNFIIARTIWQPKTHEIIPKTRGIDQARSLDIARYQEFCPIRSELGDLDLGFFLSNSPVAGGRALTLSRAERHTL